MKIRTKILSLALSAVALVGVSVAGTAAYLTSRDSVVNVFTVGQATITLDETAVDTYGDPIAGADRNKGNEYRLIPGETYVKDPTITVVAGSEEVYVRMQVTINEITALKAMCGEDFLPQNYVNDSWDATVWPCAAVNDNGDDSITYEFRYHKAVDASAATDDLVLEALFDSFTVPGTATAEQLEALKDLEITVVGHAIQAAGFADADAAWDAFDPANANETT